ncbi:hypothetical protein QBC36DRAFT_337493 [Triangularia setosa]|uniref:Uncharacterized protein n=1 Tax=Triangularia setosa TaxID=2587417 RepID=A0AAN6W0H4_9PEZI|nr:hypothetical protein QBC36DRAFT_337493 [Podospora setosa]
MTKRIYLGCDGASSIRSPGSYLSASRLALFIKTRAYQPNLSSNKSFITMKPMTFIWILVLQATSLLATPLSVSDPDTARLTAECGELGVMTYNMTALPDYIDLGAIRKWYVSFFFFIIITVFSLSVNSFLSDHSADHPFRLTQLKDPQPQKREILEKRVCYYDKPYGCGRGNRCFQQCGSGQWCWLAANHGMGDWISCSSDSQCNSVNTDWGCGVGDKDCKACGCSCSGDDPPE